MKFRQIWNYIRGDPFELYQGRSAYQHLSILVQPSINFKGMFTDGKFMAGVNTKYMFPWNSPFFVIDFTSCRPKRVLFLGGGPCCAPTAFWKRNKNVLIDVVERDEKTIHLARKYFGLPKDNRLNVIIDDATNIINTSHQQYDVIFFDLGLSYDRRSDPAYTLGLQRNIFENLARILRPRGIVLFVVISKRTGPEKHFLMSIRTAINKVFANVYLFCDHPTSANITQSYYFLASNYMYQINNAPQFYIKQWRYMYTELQSKLTPIIL